MPRMFSKGIRGITRCYFALIAKPKNEEEENLITSRGESLAPFHSKTESRVSVETIETRYYQGHFLLSCLILRGVDLFAAFVAARATKPLENSPC